jgi:hypothetical protein
MAACSVDWSLVLGFVTAVAAIVTLIVAFFGLSIWRVALKGTSKHQAAHQFRLKLRRIEHAYWEFRAPLFNEWEYPDAYLKMSIDDVTPEMEGKAYKHIFRTRWNDHMVPAWKELQAAVDEFEVATDKGIHEEYKALLDSLSVVHYESLILVDAIELGKDSRKESETRLRAGRETADNEYSEQFRSAYLELSNTVKTHAKL